MIIMKGKRDFLVHSCPELNRRTMVKECRTVILQSFLNKPNAIHIFEKYKHVKHIIFQSVMKGNPLKVTGHRSACGSYFLRKNILRTRKFLIIFRIPS